MGTRKDVIIIGGGIIGLACAYYLIKKNLSVKIIEQEEIGSGASHGNCGLLYFSGIIPLCIPGAVKDEIIKTLLKKSSLYIKPALDRDRIYWLIKFARNCNKGHLKKAAIARHSLLQYSMDLFDKLFKDQALECDFEKKGVLFLFRDKKHLDHYKATNNFLKNFGMGARLLEKDELIHMEPAVKKDIAGAYYNNHDWHLRPEMLVDSLKKLLIEKGVIFEEKCKMTGFKIVRDKITHVHTVKGQYKADAFVLATGAWASEIQKQLRMTLPVQPGKGYSITMKKPDQSCKNPCYLYEKNIVATPWKTGYRLGGTMEFSGFTNSLNQKRISRLITGAGQYLNPSMGYPVIEQWSGFRPMTPDELPIIDRAVFQKNLFIATGHGMLGLTLATGTGKAVCDMICSDRTDIKMSPFSLNRF